MRKYLLIRAGKAAGPMDIYHFMQYAMLQILASEQHYYNLTVEQIK